MKNVRIMRPFILPVTMDQDFTNAMAQRLIRLRKLAGLTQVDVARELGISQGTVNARIPPVGKGREWSNYESGFRGPLRRQFGIA